MALRPTARALLAAALVFGALIEAPAASSAESGVAKDAIVFGQAAALEGPAAMLGREMREGILAAFAEANRAGGVKGRQLKLESRDDGYEPLQSIEVTRKLIDDDKVFALIGAVGTPTSEATEPIAVEAGLPFIGAFSGAEFLREPYTADVVNVRASYFQETEALVERLTRDRGYTRFAILYQDDSFGRAGLAGVENALAARGLKLVSQGAFERNTTAVKMAALEIRRGNPQAVIMIGPYKPCAEFVRLSRRLGAEPQFAAISFLDAGAFAKELGPQSAGTIVTEVVPLPTDTSLPFVARYQDALQAASPGAAPSFVTLEGYLAGRLTIAALEKIPGEPTRSALIGAIRGATFELGGLTLAYDGQDNRGSDAVYLTVIEPDGLSRAVRNLNQPGG